MKLMFSTQLNYYRSIPIETNEGVVSRSWLGTPTGTVDATTYPASSRRMQEIYGQRLNQMVNLITYDDVLKVNDRVDVRGQTYEVVGIMQYSSHNELDLELVQA